MAGLSDLYGGAKAKLVATGVVIAAFGVLGGYFLGACVAGEAKATAARRVEHTDDRVGYFEMEMSRLVAENEEAKRLAEVDARLGKAMESTLRGALEAEAEHFGTAGDYLRRAMKEIRAVQKLVGDESRRELEAILAGYEPVSNEVRDRIDGTTPKIIEIATLLDAGRVAGFK